MLRAERTWTVDAPPAAVYAVLADVEGYVAWHPFFASVQVIERDAEGRPARATCTHPTPVATLTTEISYAYEPGSEVQARRSSGDLKDVDGTFTVTAAEALSVVTHKLLVDPGMRLGLLLRGPVEERVRQSVLNGVETGLGRAVAERG